MDDDFAVVKQGSDVVFCRHGNVMRLQQGQLVLYFNVALDDAGFARQARAQVMHAQHACRLQDSSIDGCQIGVWQGFVHQHVERFAAYAYGAPAYPRRQTYADDGIGLVPTIQAHAQCDEDSDVAEDVSKLV